ncbi:hypothetical protein [Terrihabitans sp. B22-R8]|uniref:hypothetical protein n=1 Tax=Terrihabitans sp. B22-R8 TaxID=3425128 RepID=UPI00403CC171
MADYYPLLSRAVGGLQPNTAETRRSVYERARQAIVKQLRSYDPPLSESEITRERLALEEAVRRLESEMGGGVPGASSVPVGSTGREAAEAASQGAVAADSQVRERVAAGDLPRARPRADAPRPPVPPRAPQLRPPVVPGQNAAGADVLPASRSRWPAIAAVAAVLVLAALGAWAYFARDQLSASLGDAPVENQPATQMEPKNTDRVGQSSDVPETPPAASETPNAPPPEEVAVAPDAVPDEAPALSEDSASLVAQRAILYEETPDQRGGTAFQGSIVWRTETAANSSETVLRGDISVPERNISASLLMQRNTDPTLPASHTIDIQFTLPPDFPNAGISSVPGILFKPSEEAGGAALSGLSVKVTANFFLIGLSAAPRDLAENMKAVRERPWIDIPLLYDNGRRAVLTIEKGTPGERAFNEALAAWAGSAPVAGSQGQPGVPSPQ